MNVTGFSHVTINVRDVVVSLHFYQELLGMRLAHRGDRDAYLEWGSAWVCLQERDVTAGSSAGGVDHVAFHISEENFPAAVTRLQRADVTVVRGPVRRGTGWSMNFLDPDGTQIELHTATLAERMTVWS